MSDAEISSKTLHANDTASSGDHRHTTGSDRAAKHPPLNASPASLALFLDVDGTLLTIAPHPDAVRVPEALLTLLGCLDRRTGGAVALISGREIANLDSLFAPLRLPCAGVHGLERRGADAVVHRGDAAVLLEPLRPRLAAYVAARQGLLLEDKRQSLALHFRNAPEYETELEALLVDLVARAAPALELKCGKMVLEVKPSGANKGTAIAAFMEEPPFAGRTPVFIGDDVTDEDGFAMVNRLGGLSIRVGFDRNSAAAYSLPDEEAVYAWLRAWLAHGPQADDQPKETR